MSQILNSWEEEPFRIRNRDLRKQKYKDQKEENTMSRPHTNTKRTKPMGTHGTAPEYCGPALGSEKQYKHTGPKYAGPNYIQASVTGPLQNGGRGGRGAK